MVQGYYRPIVENQMEKKMEHEMETGGIPGLKEFHLVTIWDIYIYIYPLW